MFKHEEVVCGQALVEQIDGSCVRAQLPTVLKRRHREYEPRVDGVQNQTPIIGCKEPAFTNEEFLKRYHQSSELQ